MASLRTDVRRRAARPVLRGTLTLVLGCLLAPPAVAVSSLSFEDLVANLKSPTAKTREDAAQELGKSRRREAVAPLSALVRDPEPKVRLAVVRALGLLRDPDAVPALVTSLQDGDPDIREEAIGTLVELYGERDRGGPVSRFLETFSDEYDRSSVPPYTSVDPTVFQGLARTLRDEETRLRTESAHAIGILGGGGVTSALVAAVQDPEADVRAAAATALGKVGTLEEGRALVPLLSDSSTNVRNRAVQAIGVLQVNDAGPALRELFEQNRRREQGTRYLAALARIGDRGQADLFRELVASTDPERRRRAVEGLARIADPSMLVGFKKDFQREGNEDVRLAHAFALARLGDRAFLDSIVLALGSAGSRGRRARDYLLELGPSIVPDLYPYLNDREAKVRGALCDVLSQLGDPGAIEPITPLLADPSPDVADRANRAIQRLRRVGTGSTPLP